MLYATLLNSCLALWRSVNKSVIGKQLVEYKNTKRQLNVAIERYVVGRYVVERYVDVRVTFQ